MAAGGRIAREILEAAGGSIHEAKKILEASRKFSTLVDALGREQRPGYFDYQADILDDWKSRLIHWTAPRQVGKSFTMSDKGVSKAVSVPNSRSLFISLSLDDAREKIDNAKTLLEVLESVPGCPRIESMSVSQIKLSNGARLQAIYSPRGKTKADLYLDEFAHHPNARKIYRASIPILILGGRLLMGSTVLSKASLFSEIRRGEGGKYKSFRRVETVWWDCPIHCIDVETARRESPGMSVEERVAKFGTIALQEIFDGMPLEDFMCEFEGVEIGEDDAWLSWELITKCTPAADDPEHVKPLSIEELEHIVARNQASQTPEMMQLFVGWDIGRMHDASEVSVVVVGKDGIGRERLAKTFKRTEFSDQEAYHDRIMRLPGTFSAIDETGMGLPISERARKKHGAYRVTGVNFAANIPFPIPNRDREGPAKHVMAIVIKEAMLSGVVRWQLQPGWNSQMHSIRRHVTENINLVFRVDNDAGAEQSGGKHHADRFWARALASWRWYMKMHRGGFEVKVR